MIRKVKDFHYQLCWKILCDTNTIMLISRKRFEQMMGRELRSQGQRR